MFIQAKPVWLQDKEAEMNVTAVFTQRARLRENAELYIAASSFYRLYVNDKFAAFGPARTAKGYARVDMIPLNGYDTGEESVLRIEVAAYNCRSLSTCISQGFLCAELRCGETVTAYTGRDFEAALLCQKEQYVERYSIQRHFGEVWDLTRQEIPMPAVPVERAPIFLPRIAPYPHYDEISLSAACFRGNFEDCSAEPERPNRYSWKEIPKKWGKFEEHEIPRKPFRFYLRQRQSVTEKNISLPLTLRAGEYAVFKFTGIECGFLRFSGKSLGGADVVLGFSEYSEGDRFSLTDINCQNVIECVLPAGFDSSWQSFEPYTMQFMIIMVKSGDLTLSGCGITTYERDMSGAGERSFALDVHQKIYDAALRSFAHNAVDLYTDCPSRERAGWLCDSYFTAPAEHYLFGAVPVEDAFLENHRLCNHPLLPRGMRAKCYPSDVDTNEHGMGNHIPQWSMWYVLEVAEYLSVRNKTVDPEIYRESVEGVLEYLEWFENSDGLLEDLPSWNFVEWSDANNWTRNVNYPTNFLYAETLLAAHSVYGREAWERKAKKLQKRTAELSFDGELFTDNAVRDENGVLRNTGNTSEACQYYALLFGDIDLNNPQYAKAKARILAGWRDTAVTDRRFVPVNAFIGLYLRIKTLLKFEEYQRLLEDVEYYFGGMAEKTGTLWEYREMKGSMDHGFASYAAYAMCIAIEKLK